ncbi:MAG: aminoacyl-tRNA hydrolase [Candidatus Woesebacteria bacterium]|nr:aminoacyl-tRNA hydrolase [Candidatus Woesebacteria bacterium]
MKLVVGLGNPGEKYKNTRHNAGFLVAEELQKQITKSKSQIPNKAQILIFKSKNFMNDSGNFVKKLINRYSLSTNNLFVIHDDLDIPLGSYKIQFGTGPKVHNGVNSVEQELGTKDFWRIRVGVDNRSSNDRIQGEDYVLEDFKGDERKLLDGVIEKICKETNNLLQ